MRTSRLSTVRAAGVLLPLAVVAAVAGCAEQDPAGAGATPDADPPSSTPVGSGEPSVAVPSGAVDEVSDCRTDGISVTAIAQPQQSSGTTRMAILQVVNTSSAACAVEGWLTVTLVNPVNEAVPVDTRTVDQPSPPVRVQVPAGGSAWAGIKWQTCDKGASDCAAGNSLRVSLAASEPGAFAELEGFPAQEQVDITMRDLQVGSLQPQRDGVVSW